MPKINVAAVIYDMVDKPVRTQDIPSVERAKLVKLRSAWAAASPVDQPALEEDLRVKTEEAQEKLTVGRAVINALTTTLPDDDKLVGARKLDLFEMALRVKAAGDKPVEFDNGMLETIKDRVSRAYPSVVVVGQVFKAISNTPD